MTPFLEVKDMKKQYGAIKAVDGVSMSVGPGEIVGVIGPNGSGKTTLFNSILGQIQPTAGKVEFCGEDITGMSPLQLSRRGVGRTFQTLQVFTHLSVRDNLIAAAQEFKGTLGQPPFRGARRRAWASRRRDDRAGSG
jgi:branched-chain amino acid transport system ATP-binding protein